MANALLTPTAITAETLRIVHNQSAFLGRVNHDYEDNFATRNAKVGYSINIRKPVQFSVRSGPVANLQDVNEQFTSLTVQPEIGVDWYFSDADLTMTIDKFSDRYLKPAAARLATAVDMNIAALFSGMPNYTGTPGTSPATANSVLSAGTLLTNQAAPMTDRMLGINPLANQTLVNGLAGFFNDQQKVGAQYKSGMMAGNTLGFDEIFVSQNMPTYTVGPQGGTPLVNGANQGLTNAGSTDNPAGATTSLVTNGWTAAAALRLRAGDVITIAGVNAVNPDNKQDTGQLRQFVVTANASSDASGNLTAVIAPAIVAGGAYQNVTARPASGAAVTVVSGTANTTYGQNIFWQKDAITFASVPMEVPNGVDMSSQTEQDGIHLRFIRDYDPINNRRICRFDILAAYGLIRPEWAGRLTS